MSGKILVTGATGKVGAEVVKQLAAVGANVRAGLHHPEKATGQNTVGVESVHFDYSDTASMAAALDGVSAFFFMSPALPNAPEIETTLLDLAKAAGVQHIAKLSAAGASANESNPLYLSEQRVVSSGIGYTILRPTFFNQNFSTADAGNIKEGVISLPAGDGKISFIDTRDIAAVAVAALTDPATHAGKTYTLTGSQPLSHYDVAALISDAIGKKVTYNPLADEDYRTSLAAQYWPQSGIAMMSDLYRMVRNGGAAFVASGVNDALGRAPISFAQFAQDYAHVWK